MPFTYTYSNPGIDSNLISVSYSGTDSTVAQLASSVTSIGTQAFATATVRPVLTAVDCSLATSLVTIENLAFWLCSQLTSINIPSTVNTIGEQCFQQTGFRTFSWPTTVNVINRYMFYQCSSLTYVNLPNNVNSVINYAFSRCGALTYVSLPNTVTNISDEAFSTCQELRSFAWPSATNIINYQVFLNCGKLTSISGIPLTITSINQNAFSGCSSLSLLSIIPNIPNTVRTIASGAFSFTPITSVSIPSSVTTIGSNVFNGCSGLTQIRLQKMTTPLIPLASNSFAGITGITSSYPSYTNLLAMLLQGYTTTNLTDAGFNAAAITAASNNNQFTYTYSDVNKTVINSVTYSGSVSTTATPLFSVTSIGANAFSTSSVTSVLTTLDNILATSLVNIGSSAFENCSVLTSLSLPNTVTNIGSSAFSRSGFLNLSWWPTGSTVIDDSTFSFCTSLTNITVPSTVNSINTLAFDNCTSLTNINLPYLTKPSRVILNFNSFSNTTSINDTNYSTLSEMKINGYSRAEVTTAGFDPLAINEVYGIICFKEGTKILTDKGYVAIENLRKGDLVKTLKNDYKPIFMIGYSKIYNLASHERVKDQLYKCCNKEFPEVFEDLIITGGHSILVDNFVSETQREKTISINGDIYVTDAKYRLPACIDERTHVYEVQGNYTIYHLALENENYYYNYGIYANGLLVESCSKRFLKELSFMTMI